jgi:3-oxoacyl-[acyl-carrier protein] reductase
MTDQSPPQRFAGRTVMVTGAGTGYGAEIAVRAAQEGARTVVVHYRSSAAGAEQTAQRVQDAGAQSLLIQGDIVSWADIKRMATTVDEELGSLDVLINNVGDMASEQDSWRDITEELIDHTLAVDIKGTMLMTHEFGTRMLARERGAIVNIGSTVIVRGSPRAPQYAAGKYGVLGLTKSYAKAFAPHVRVNTFAPGFMKTERVLNRADWQAGRGEQLAHDTPAGRIPEPEELAGTALFLASDEAAHITGTYMICDGGYSMLGA